LADVCFVFLTCADQQQQQQHQAADPISLPTFYAHSNSYSSESSSVNPTQPQQSLNLPFNVVNLRYDLTPIGNISVVATETGLTPPTSIPVLMREMQQSQQQQQQQQQQTMAATISGASGNAGICTVFEYFCCTLILSYMTFLFYRWKS